MSREFILTNSLVFPVAKEMLVVSKSGKVSWLYWCLCVSVCEALGITGNREPYGFEQGTGHR